MAAGATQPIAALPAAYARLDDGQRDAVDSKTSTVVLAGPGSGKTETLAVKAAILLQQIPSPQGVMCITYTRAAARAIDARVRRLTGNRGRRLACGTLHSFCLNHVLGPYAMLVDEEGLARPEIIGQQKAAELLAMANEQTGRQVASTTLQRMRRAEAAGEELTPGFTVADIEVMERYEALLQANTCLDFDGMIHEALRLAHTHPVIVDLITARFPWLLVDEYQDLGAPLHVLVQILRQPGSIEVFAVGDPDQTILGFTGADARYLESLEGLGYKRVDLPFNYRSGSALVRAAAAARSGDRVYTHHPDREDPGEVIALEIGDGMVDQMTHVVDSLIPSLVHRFPLHEIAILYPRQGWHLDRIIEALQDRELEYSLERDARFGISADGVVGWLQRAAQWSIDDWTERRGRFRELARDLHDFIAATIDRPVESDLDTATRLLPMLEEPLDPETGLSDWLLPVVTNLGLQKILSGAATNAAELEALATLLDTVESSPELSVQDFAGPVRRPGRLVVTTYHSSKGREFDAVILPGLQDGVIPYGRVVGGRWKFGSLAADQKLFYVAVTRARHVLALLWSEPGENAWGDPKRCAQSRFVAKLVAEL